MEMGSQLEIYKAVHSRRHNGKYPWSPNARNKRRITIIYKLIVLARVDADMCFMASAVSIRAMVDKIRSALENKHAPATLESVGIKIPSHSYVAMQLSPKDKCTSKALSYTGDYCSWIVVVMVLLLLMLFMLLLLL